MYSNLVPFETILEAIKDDTGMTVLDNHLPKIRRLIYRCEKDIGFGGTTFLKRIKYSALDGSIITGGDQYKIKLPEDLLYLEDVGMCEEGICPNQYTIQNKYLFFCEDNQPEEFSLIYHALLCDPEGNPVVTENHMEAVVSGVCYYMYRSRRFNDKGSAQTYAQMERYYEDRVAEARGDDFFPTTAKEWSQAANLMQMSSKDILLYDPVDRCFCPVPESLNPFAIIEPEIAEIYSFQFDNILFKYKNFPN